MIVRAFAKVNLGLAVGAHRPDGYHELETVFQAVGLCDELDFDEADSLRLEVEGDAPEGPENLVLRAAEWLAREAGVKARAAIRLKKRIPSGGGLGGGSSDAAATLIALDRLWRTRAAAGDLWRLALALGSDVPYFLLGGTALGLGRGERLFAIAELPPRAVLLALPGLQVATAEAFAAHDRRAQPAVPAGSWRHAEMWDWSDGALAALANDLEEAVFGLCPSLRALKETIARAGAELALMSGSGSTVFGIFPSAAAAERGLGALGATGVGAVVVPTLDRAACRSCHDGGADAPAGRAGHAGSA